MSTSAGGLRVSAYAEGAPENRVLVSVDAGTSLAQLRDAVGARLGATVHRVYLAETQTQVLDVVDLRDGDVLRVTAAAAAAAGGATSKVRFSPDVTDGRQSWRDSPAWREVVRWLLTLVIFTVVFFQAFQRLVMIPKFRPDLLDDPTLVPVD